MNATSESSSPVRNLKIHPPILAAGLLAAGLILHFILPEARDTGWHHVLGVLMIAGGIGLSAFAAATFTARGTTKNPYGEPSEFVAAAPYTFTRNPMYLGVALALLGCAVLFDSIVMLLAPAVFYAAIDTIVIPREEHTMLERFGEQYREYQGRVRRWL
ncbi:MAG TPA: isoprenylcysteine carboxylmethyltransferase family protein [Candidatus Binataceae bacterium]|nr:isoprenylcysteine carboxylmethyltransferase family protein [Candidatus Binataceae bacterium]